MEVVVGNMETFCKIGDTIGYIRKSQKFGDTDWKWGLSESKVNSMRICKDGIHVYAKGSSPLYDEEIRSNTKIMTENKYIILVYEPFLLNDDTRARATRWIEWVNEHPENEKNALDFDNFDNGFGSTGR